MKKQSLLLVMMLLPMVASAYDIAVENADGVTIYYNYINDGKKLGVTYLKKIYDENRNTYVGSITIPEEVTYMNRTRGMRDFLCLPKYHRQPVKEEVYVHDTM
jgi:hypothetical protein